MNSDAPENAEMRGKKQREQPDSVYATPQLRAQRNAALAHREQCVDAIARIGGNPDTAVRLVDALEQAVRLLRIHADAESLGGSRFDLTDCREMKTIFSVLKRAKKNLLAGRLA